MSKGNRLTVRVDKGEACVVAPEEVFEHIVEVFRIHAYETEDELERQNWLETAEHIQYWAERTVFKGEEQNDDEW
jgi:hypothetical protein